MPSHSRRSHLEQAWTSHLRRLELIDRYPFFYPPPSSHFFLSDTLALPPLVDDVYEDVFLHDLDHDLVLPTDPYPPLDALDLFQIETSLPFYHVSIYRSRALRRTVTADSDPFLLGLLGRVTAQEHRFEKVLGGGRRRDIKGERKYEWTAEIEGKDEDWKCKWKAQINPGKEQNCESFKRLMEVKEKGKGGERTYTWTESYGGEDKKHRKEKKGKKEK